MGEALVQRVAGRIDNVARRIEIRFADFEMNDVPPLGLERAGFDQNLERRLRPEPRHPPGQSQFASVTHEGESTFRARQCNFSFFDSPRICPRSLPDYL